MGDDEKSPMTGQEMQAAIERWVHRGDRAALELIAEAIRAGRVEVQASPRRVCLVVTRSGPRSHLAIRLRALRVEAGSPTQDSIAEAIGVSVSALIRMLNGDTTPGWPTVRLYVEHLGGNADDYKADYAVIADGRSRRQVRGENP